MRLHKVVGVMVMALLFAGLAAAQPPKAKSWTGVVTDSMCGAKHMGTGAACVRSCVKEGMKPVFVDPHKNVWAIDNPDAVKNFYGDHVKVKATENASAKSVHIDSISAAK